MAQAAVTSADQSLLGFAAECFYDPLKWVLACYPWGQPGTFLANEPGPDDWQCDVLRAIGQELLLVDLGKGATNAAQIAIGSGHGTGKTTLESWVIQWWLTTRPSPAANVTAGTDTQLKTKLWRELRKWHAVSINAHWFEWTATAFKSRQNPIAVANAIPWSEHNAHAFAGLHEADPLAIFEESSVIADVIWNTQEGAFTTPGGLWLVVGNITEPSGKFYDCFERDRKWWRCFNIDSRTARKADKTRIAQWAEQYGEDSDFFRVRVKGLAPQGGETRLFTPELIDKAVRRVIEDDWLNESTPLIAGIDPAGGGSSITCLVFRKGPVVKKEWIVRFSEPDHMRVASLIAANLSKFKPDYAFIDAHGIGKGIFDRLNQLGYRALMPAYGGDKSAVLDKLNYFNPRAEWWGRVADWLRVSHIPPDRDLRDQLLRQPMKRSQMRLQLMSKEDMRKINLDSPDVADALALSFSELVSVKRDATSVALEGGIPEYT